MLFLVGPELAANAMFLISLNWFEKYGNVFVSIFVFIRYTYYEINIRSIDHGSVVLIYSQRGYSMS